VPVSNFDSRLSAVYFVTVSPYNPHSRTAFIFLFHCGTQNNTMVTIVTMGGDLQPGCLTDRLLTVLGQPQINP